MQKAAGELLRSFPLLRSASRWLSPTMADLVMQPQPSPYSHLPLIKRLSRDEPLLLDGHLSHTAELMDYYDCFLVDCDGVLWRGTHLIEGAVDCLRLLKRRGKKVFFLTNNSTKTCEQYVDKLRSLGIDAELPQICSSAYLLGQYFKETLPNCKKVYVIGQEGIEAELAKVGVETFGGQRDNNRTINEQLFCELELPQPYDAVVCGWDVNFNFYKLSLASLAFQENEKCLFVATNRDAYDRVGNDSAPATGATTRSRVLGRCIPGAGGIVAAIECATGRKPILVGKPSPWIVDHLMKVHDLRRERILMIGDRLDTDILLGRKGNIDTLLVLTGVNSKSDAYETKILPNYIASSIGILNKV